MSKSPDAFRTISEVADWLGVQAHVLRFWESKFTQVKPVKRAGGRRYYRPADMLLLGGIKQLLHDDGMTIKGAQKILREQGVAHVSGLSRPLDGDMPDEATVESTVVPFAPPTEPPQPTLRAVEPPPPEVIEPEPEVSDEVEAPLETTEGDSPEEEAQPSLFTADEGEFEVVLDEEDEEPTEADEPVMFAGSDELDEAEEPAMDFEAAFEPEEAPESFSEPETAETASAPAPRSPELPSFIRSPLQPPAPSPDAPSELRARIVDAPDPPAEAEIEAAPGALSKIARIYALDADDAALVAPLAARLAVWLERTNARRVS